MYDLVQESCLEGSPVILHWAQPTMRSRLSEESLLKEGANAGATPETFISIKPLPEINERTIPFVQLRSSPIWKIGYTGKRTITSEGILQIHRSLGEHSKHTEHFLQLNILHSLSKFVSSAIIKAIIQGFCSVGDAANHGYSKLISLSERRVWRRG